MACAEATPVDSAEPEGLQSSIEWGRTPSLMEDQLDGSIEVCDGVDNNGDGQIDENGSGPGGWLDRDGDGYGNPDRWLPHVCIGPHVAPRADDCNDHRADVHPGAAEHCGQRDRNCDGEVVPQDARWVDRDGDGWFEYRDHCQDDGLTSAQLSARVGRIQSDCDDTDARAYPGATEVCGDGLVFDCESYEADPDCLNRAACPSFWPLDALEGLRVSLRQEDDWLYWDTGTFLGQHLRADTYAWDSEASGGGTTSTEQWTLACTEDGVVRIDLTTQQLELGYCTSTSEVASTDLPSPPVALPARLEEGVLWEEVGIRHGRVGHSLFGLAEAIPDFTTLHTVTDCAVLPVPPTGNRTVCTIASTDDDGEAWTWTVAEGLGPIDIDGPERLWIDQPE